MDKWNVRLKDRIHFFLKYAVWRIRHNEIPEKIYWKNKASILKLCYPRISLTADNLKLDGS